MNRYLLMIAFILSSSFCYCQQEGNNILLSFQGQSITTINDTTIAHNYGRTLAQLLNDQPGIVINGAYQPMGSLVSIYMEGTLGGRALILLNGIPVYDPSSLPDYFDLNFISLYEIERIDIYHGAQSTTMGNGAFAGAINIITTKKEENKLIQIKAHQTFGNESTSNSNIQLWGKKSKWDYSASYSRISTVGFSLAQDTTGNQNFDKDGFKSNIINTRLQYTANNNLKLKAYCLFSQYKADSDADAYNNQTDYYYKDKLLNIGTGFNYHKHNLLLVGNYQFNQTTHYYHYDNLTHENYKGRSHFAELYLKKTINKYLILLLGIDYRNTFMFSEYDDQYGITNYYYPQYDIYSFYSKLSYMNKDSSIAIDFIDRQSHLSSSGTVWNYNLSGKYRMNKNVSLMGGITTGYKAPCIYQLYNSYGLNNSSLLPEKTIEYYIGISKLKIHLLHKLRLYYSKLSNLIYSDPNISMYDNISSQKTWGLQYELEYNINNSFKLTADYTFTKGAEHTISHYTYVDTNFDYLYRRPEHILKLCLHYKYKDLSLGLIAKYVSEYYDVVYGYNADILVDKLIIINAYSNYTINHQLNIFCNIQNLMNNKFFDVPGLNSIPILLTGGISYKFK